MLQALPMGEVAAILGVLMVTGLCVGFLSGLLGIGGGGLLVPVLFEVFRFLDVPDGSRLHLAIGTSLAVMIPTTIRSFFAHASRGGTDTVILRRLAVPILIGVATGSIIAKWSPADALKWVWVIFGLLLVTKLFFGRESWRLGPDVPKSLAVELYAIVVGTISTIMSIGGGAYITALLTLYGRSIQQAVGTSSGFGPLIAIPGMIGFIWAGWNEQGLPLGSIGYVNLLGFIALVPTSVFMAPVGARIAHGVSRRRLEIIMGCFILTISLRFLVSIVADV
ncbi:MAG: sulfite exporter TauE/SafE family protein [Alphaproteobacteria bacterium]|nr:sulfite exporter TauE/SafE family protein [Alphaproteobacteria bacterium]